MPHSFRSIALLLWLVSSACGDDMMSDSGVDAPDAAIDGDTPDSDTPDSEIDADIPDGDLPDGDLPDGTSDSDLPDGAIDGDLPDGDVPDSMDDADTGGPGHTQAVNQLPGADYALSFSGIGSRASTLFTPITGGLVVGSNLLSPTVENELGERTEFEGTTSRLIRRTPGEPPTVIADYRLANFTRLATMADGGFAAVATHRRNGGVGDAPSDVLPVGVTGQVVARYDSEGELIWGARFENRIGPVSSPSACAREEQCLQIFDIASSDESELYVVGAYEGTVDVDPDDVRSENIGGGGYLAKYGADGALLWALPFLAEPNSIAATPEGVVVAGSFEGTVDFDPSDGSATRSSNGDRDIFIARYSDEGVFESVSTLGGSLDDSPAASGLAVRGDVLALSARYQDSFDANPADGVAMLPDAGRRPGRRNQVILRFEGDEVEFTTLGLIQESLTPGVLPAFRSAQVALDARGGALFAVGIDTERDATSYGRINGSGLEWIRNAAERPRGTSIPQLRQGADIAVMGDAAYLLVPFNLFANFSTADRPLLVGRFDRADSNQRVSAALVQIDPTNGDVEGSEIAPIALEVLDCDACVEISEGCPIACFGDEFVLAAGVVSQSQLEDRGIDVAITPTSTGAHVAWRAEIAREGTAFPSANVVVRDVRDGGALSEPLQLTEGPERISLEILGAFEQQGGGSLVTWSAENELQMRWVNADATDDEALDFGDDARTSFVRSVGRLDDLYCVELSDTRGDRSARCITRAGIMQSAGRLPDSGMLTALHDRLVYWRTANFGSIPNTDVQEVDASMMALALGTSTVVFSGTTQLADSLSAIGDDGMAFFFRSLPTGATRQPPRLLDVREAPGSADGRVTRVDPMVDDSVADYFSVASVSGSAEALIAWTRRGVAPGVVDQCDVWGRIVDAEGELSAPFRLHDEASGCHFRPHAVASEDGTVTIVWSHLEVDEDSSEYGLRGVILPELLGG